MDNNVIDLYEQFDRELNSFAHDIIDQLIKELDSTRKKFKKRIKNENKNIDLSEYKSYFEFFIELSNKQEGSFLVELLFSAKGDPGKIIREELNENTLIRLGRDSNGPQKNKTRSQKKTSR